MKLGGVSVKGSCHEVCQDCFTVMQNGDTAVLAVSDGLGSKRHSEKGSAALCRCAEAAAAYGRECSPEELCRKVCADWSERIGADAENCCATALMCFIFPDRIIAARLGDGFIAAVYESGAVLLTDDKSDHFSNETDCLGGSFCPDAWETVKLPVSGFIGVVACTDGVELDTQQPDIHKSFARDLFEGYSDLTAEAMDSDIRAWLSDWPGGDDKTLAYIAAEGVDSDES